MKKIFTLALCFLLLAALSSPALADAVRVIDEAELLTDEEESVLEEKIRGIRDNHSLDVVILTVETTWGESVQTYADDYYEENGFGCGDDRSGILLLLNMGTREWYISTAGQAIYIFTDYGLEQMGNDMLPNLSRGDYFGAFSGWLNQIPDYCDATQGGFPIDGFVGPDAYEPEGGDETVYYPSDSEPNPVLNFVIALAIGLAAAGISVAVMSGGMNTARKQSNAASYLKNGSFQMHTQRDMFLYRTVTKTPRPQSTGGGGGSSVHRSSGGMRHGGRGGRF